MCVWQGRAVWGCGKGVWRQVQVQERCVCVGKGERREEITCMAGRKEKRREEKGREAWEEWGSLPLLSLLSRKEKANVSSLLNPWRERKPTNQTVPGKVRKAGQRGTEEKKEVEWREGMVMEGKGGRGVRRAGEQGKAERCKWGGGRWYGGREGGGRRPGGGRGGGMQSMQKKRK